MNGQDPEAVCRWDRKWRIALVGCALLILAPLVVFVWPSVSRPREAKMSEICAEISRDFHAHVADLAPEKELVEYFAQKGWRYSHTEKDGWYFVSLDEPNKQHRVDVRVRIVAGLVYESEIRDFYISF